MSPSGSDIDGAVVLGLSNPRNGIPGLDTQRLLDRYGTELGGELSENVSALLREAMDITVDWKTSSLDQGGEFVKAALLERHPGLSDEALRLIKGYFTYQWR